MNATTPNASDPIHSEVLASKWSPVDTNGVNATNNESKFRPGIRFVLQLGVVAILFALIFLKGIEFDMHRTGISVRYQLYAIPIAISRIDHHKPHDFTAFAAVAKVFYHGPESAGVPLENLITRARLLEKVGESGDWFISGDDKGLADYTWLAFKIFGEHVTSLYYMYFVMFGIGILIYISAFARSSARISLLIMAMLSIYTTCFVFPLSDQLANLTEPRVFDLLGLVPTIHIMLCIRTNRRFGLVDWGFLGLQTTLLIFVYFTRSAAAWQIIAIGFHTFLIAALCAVRRDWPSALKSLRPVLLVGCGLLVLSIYKSETLNPKYNSELSAAHIFYHNIFMGFALHPDLARDYQLEIDDSTVVKALDRFLVKKNDEITRAKLFDGSDPGRSNWQYFNWKVSEPAVRDMMFDLAITRPQAFVETFLIYKSIVLAREVLWAAGLYPQDVAKLYLQFHALPTDEIRSKKSLFYNPFRPLCILVIFSILALGWKDLSAGMIESTTMAVTIVAFSALPGFLTYPVFQNIGATFSCISLMIYVILIYAVARGCGLVQRHYANTI